MTASGICCGKSCVATPITTEQTNAPAVHCYSYSLSLTVKQLTSSCEVLSDTMGAVGEIRALKKVFTEKIKLIENNLGVSRRGI